MSLTPPPPVRKLQDALHSKAKDAPGYRFYALYDKLYRADILRFAYDRCKANGGAPGVDGQDFADIEAQGLGAWLGALTEELREETYRPQPVRRVNIPKDGQPGKFRPLGIPAPDARAVTTAGHYRIASQLFAVEMPRFRSARDSRRQLTSRPRRTSGRRSGRVRS